MCRFGVEVITLKRTDHIDHLDTSGLLAHLNFAGRYLGLEFVPVSGRRLSTQEC